MHDTCDLIEAAETRNDFAELYCIVLFFPPNLPAIELWGNLVIPDTITSGRFVSWGQHHGGSLRVPCKEAWEEDPSLSSPLSLSFSQMQMFHSERGEPPEFIVCLNRLYAAQPEWNEKKKKK